MPKFKLHYMNDLGVGYNVVMQNNKQEADALALALDKLSLTGKSKSVRLGTIHWAEEIDGKAVNRQH